MNYEIKNRVSKSPIKTIDLEDFIGNINIVVFDIKSWLKDDLILVEKDFREKINSVFEKLFGREYWDKIINFEYLADHGLIADEHLNLFKYADSASEAWEIIKLSKNTV